MGWKRLWKTLAQAITQQNNFYGLTTMQHYYYDSNNNYKSHSIPSKIPLFIPLPSNPSTP